MSMTFVQFLATGRDVPNLADEGLEEEGGGRVYVSRGGPFINQMPDGAYFLTIYGEQWAEPLPLLEARLFDWAQGEGILDAPGQPAAWSDDFASQPDAVARLADAFRDVLKEWVGELGIRRIRRANVAFAGTDTCASHDECDANMAMDEATRRTFGAGPLDGPQEHMTDTAMKLWADAWDKAKADYLTDAA